MKKVLPWLTGAALVLAAGTVAAVTPDPVAQDGPFLIRGAADQPVASRDLIVRVGEARFADRVTVDDEWHADGNWFVVSLSAAATQTEVDAAIRLMKLVVDGREFIASERPSTSLIGVGLRVGTDTEGMVAFELPEDITTGDAEIRVSTPHSTPHLDDVIVVPLHLDDLPREHSIEIAEPSIEEMP
ncbi:MAG: hypothetical protein JF592_14500 [Microbacterium sp.]|uniref:Uncharacterized protein n=1 Tax=Microbacterium natoriense TaxID=284570 RepID=A0AAW8F4V6_9MICO|nr:MULTISPECIES: hypothetical protein [Microbacterium]MBW8763770.1 hypothetical protein [Microbacterium sp.]MDQ0649486.1 hypothetical protein [Microbacterium natoriense]